MSAENGNGEVKQLLEIKRNYHRDLISIEMDLKAKFERELAEGKKQLKAQFLENIVDVVFAEAAPAPVEVAEPEPPPQPEPVLEAKVEAETPRGVVVLARECPECGAPIHEEDKFCSRCAAPLKEDEKSVSVASRRKLGTRVRH